MNGCLSSLTQLGIVAVPFGIFFGTWCLCGALLGFDSPLPMPIAAATLAPCFFGAFWWMSALHKKENRILGTLEHPFFGTVQQKADSWHAVVTVPAYFNENVYQLI